jgi:hypothetical protein
MDGGGESRHAFPSANDDDASGFSAIRERGII